MKKIVVLLHDDWELRGNGSGDVAHLQYLPAQFLMNVADDLGIKLTFMAEVMQQTTFLRYAERDPNLRAQSRLWEDTVRLMKQRDFDVQPHIHPHWHDATYEGGRFRLGQNWNLATYPSDIRMQLIRDCKEYLEHLVREVDPEYEARCFKAGAWGLQPSEGILEDLREAGFHVIVGVSLGMRITHPAFQLDYTQLEEDTLPYFPAMDDVTRVSREDTGIVVLPAAHYRVDWQLKWARLLRHLTSGSSKGREAEGSFHEADPSETERPASPLLSSPSQKLFRKGLRSYLTHLDLGGRLSFGEMRLAVDRIVDRLRRHPAPLAPLVIESHSKQFEGNWEHVKRLLGYVREAYDDVLEFQTFATFEAFLRNHPEHIARKGAP